MKKRAPEGSLGWPDLRITPLAVVKLSLPISSSALPQPRLQLTETQRKMPCDTYRGARDVDQESVDGWIKTEDSTCAESIKDSLDKDLAPNPDQQPGISASER
ncbi:unnamed protein product [Pleuronectes platessa]|uniref:Uncharacterized protein n=1 Tax=Pleuronectes platessa TaxID=8262 RepID=A0A9N7YL86_PLEPL|nr:unnamed protein product [Pleuronectes platessa]